LEYSAGAAGVEVVGGGKPGTVTTAPDFNVAVRVQ
jgi:hypothetical protein